MLRWVETLTGLCGHMSQYVEDSGLGPCTQLLHLLPTSKIPALTEFLQVCIFCHVLQGKTNHLSLSLRVLLTDFLQKTSPHLPLQGLPDVWTDIFWEMMLNFLKQNRLNTSWFKLEIKRNSSCRHHPHHGCISGHVLLGWVLLPGSHTEWHGPWWVLSYMKAQEILLFQKDLCYWPVNCLNSPLGMHSFGLKSFF